MTYKFFEYFESSSMRGLYEEMERWQNESHYKRLVSLSIQKDGETFCCIATTDNGANRVVITDGTGSRDVFVSRDGVLSVSMPR